MRLILILVFLIFSQIVHLMINQEFGGVRAKFQKKIDSFKGFKTLSASDQTFKKILKIDNNYKFNLHNPIESTKWNDVYYDLTNNSKHYKYDEKNEIIFKSKKISKYRIKRPILFQDNFVISSDQKGNLIVFSIKENKIRNKFNFYKKTSKILKRN